MPPAPANAEASRAYENFLAEWKEISDYKWIESRNEGKDIGLERALTEWVARHRVAWRAKRKQAA
jgi:hypothetical protein